MWNTVASNLFYTQLNELYDIHELCSVTQLDISMANQTTKPSSLLTCFVLAYQSQDKNSYSNSNRTSAS